MKNIHSINFSTINCFRLSALDLNEEALYQDRLWRGTTSIEACDEEGWVVSTLRDTPWAGTACPLVVHMWLHDFLTHQR